MAWVEGIICDRAPRPAPPGTRCCPGARVARLLPGAAAALRLHAPAPRREPTQRLAELHPAAAAAAAAGRGRSQAPLPPTEFPSPRRTPPRKRRARTRQPPQGRESEHRDCCSRGALAQAAPKLSPPFPSRTQSAARGAARARRALSASGGKPRAAGLRLALAAAPGLRGAPPATTWPRPDRRSLQPS